jgi:hypothetical protein
MDDQGYEVLRGAVAAETIDAYAREREAARDGLLARARGGENVELLANAGEDAGAVDPYAIVNAARAVLLPEAVTTALAGRFGDDAPLLFDAVETAAAAFEDGPYRDATYVALATEPETLTTVVVALGEATLDVFGGSQAIETSAFSGRYRHFNPERDGEDALTRHRDEIATGLGDGREPERIDLAAGDVLLLAADTVHHAAEGAALVGHLCPARVQPGWFAYRPERARHASHDDGRAWITTQHYDLVDAVEPDAAPQEPPPAAAREEELERVEDALRAHDAAEEAEAPRPGTPNAPATPPAPGPGPGQGGRRSGGLVDSVRGILGRRNRG